MDNRIIPEYQSRLDTLCAIAEKQDMTLKPEQVRQVFEGKEIDTPSMTAVLRYLHEQGISFTAILETGSPAGNAFMTSAPLSDQDKAYLQNYLLGLKDHAAKDPVMTKHMIRATTIAAEMNCLELPLPDLIQEANLALFTAAGDPDFADDEAGITRVVRKGIEKAIREAVEDKKKDDSIIEK